jgi:DNA-directed RNA polymerase specialized sigma24 family protein
MASSHYVNNADFLKSITEYREKVQKAIAEGKPKPQVPNYVGECIYKIATHLSYKPNFMNYSYREEMISDGIENCLQYIDNFDPEKSKNPFSYFTQIIYFAFLRRISKEKKQSYIKNQLITEMPFEVFELQDGDDYSSHHNAYMDFLQQHNAFDDSFIKLKQKKKEEKKNSNLDQFMENDDE